MILENTIIENTKDCFMGKMILDDLRKRLEHLATDEDELRASILNDWRYRDFISAIRSMWRGGDHAKADI